MLDVHRKQTPINRLDALTMKHLLIIAFALSMSPAQYAQQEATNNRATRPTSQSISRTSPVDALIENQQARLSSASEEERLDAIVKLGSLELPAGSRVAAQSLNDRSVRVRAAAIIATKSLPLNERAPLLLKVFADRDEFVRSQAAYSASNAVDKEAQGNFASRPFIASTISANASTVATQSSLSNGVNEVARREIEIALIRLAEADGSAAVRAAAVVSLGRLQTRAAVPTLIDLLNTRRRASGFFNRLRRRREAENEFVRRACVVALGQIGDGSATRDLIALLQTPATPADIRRESARALGVIGDASALTALRRAETSPDSFLSQIAFEARVKIEAARR